MGDSHMGLQARLMSQALRKLTSTISKSKTTVIFLNQLRMKLGVMFGNPETTTGGNALKFYASVRLDIRNIGKIEEGSGETKEIKGSRVRVKIVKNKIAPPFKTAEFDIMYNKGISYTGDLIDLATKYEITSKSGAFYAYKELKLGQGRENAKSFISANEKVMKSIEKDVFDHIGRLKKEENDAQEAAFKKMIVPTAKTAAAATATAKSTRSAAQKEV